MEEKLIILGCEAPNKFLTLPSLKQYRRDDASATPLDAKEKNFQELLLSKAVKRKKFRNDHIEPSVFIDYRRHKVPQTLQDLLQSRDFYSILASWMLGRMRKK